MAEETNGVIYLEVDEDITSAIDKLGKSAGKRVQVVTAKRSTLFQSVINLKLIQKAAKDAKKDLVLVTGDRVATSLAGRIGVAVASQVGESAAVPASTPLSTTALADDEIDGGAIGAVKPEEAAVPAAEEAITPPPAAPETTPPPSASPKPKGSKVPNIGKMQKRLIWGVLAVAIIILLFVLNYYLTTAHVTLYAQGSQVNASFSFTADPSAQQSNVSAGVLSAQQLSENKTLNTTVTATGTKDNGSKASGTMTVSNCVDNQSHTLPAGTQFQAPNGLIFASTADVTVPGGSGNFLGCNTPGKASVGVQAAANGDQYNLGSGTKYAIVGLPSGEQSSFNGTGAQMSGGVTKIDKVITQNDVNQAQAAALAANKSNATSDLSGKASKQQTALAPSFAQNVTSSNPNPDVGSAASSGSLAIQVTYTELAVQKSELSKLATSEESQQLGPQKQVYDDGSSNLKLTPSPAGAGGAQKFRAEATASAGTKIDTGAVAKQLKGQKLGDAKATASQVSGITNSNVSVTPGWATSMPHIVSHIHVTVKVASQSGS